MRRRPRFQSRPLATHRNAGVCALPRLPPPPACSWYLLLVLVFAAAYRALLVMERTAAAVAPPMQGRISNSADDDQLESSIGTDAAHIMRAFAVAERFNVTAVPHGDVVTLRRIIEERLVDVSALPPALIALASHRRVCAMCADYLGTPMHHFLLSSGRPEQAESRTFTCSKRRLELLRASVVAALSASARRADFHSAAWAALAGGGRAGARPHGGGAGVLVRRSNFSITLLSPEWCDFACLAALVAPLTKHSIVRRQHILRRASFP